MKAFKTTIGFLGFCTAANGVRVDHAFGLGAEFKTRGSLDILIDSPQVASPATMLPVKLSGDIQGMEALIANNGLYLIRLATDEFPYQHVVAAIPACQLRLASFREEITLHVDWDGVIIGVDYNSPVGPLASTKDCTKMPLSETAEITTKASVVRSATAQIVPLQVVSNSPPPGLQNLKELTGSKDSKVAESQSLLEIAYLF